MNGFLLRKKKQNNNVRFIRGFIPLMQVEALR